MSYDQELANALSEIEKLRNRIAELERDDGEFNYVPPPPQIVRTYRLVPELHWSAARPTVFPGVYLWRDGMSRDPYDMMCAVFDSNGLWYDGDNATLGEESYRPDRRRR